MPQPIYIVTAVYVICRFQKCWLSEHKRCGFESLFLGHAVLFYQLRGTEAGFSVFGVER